VLPEAFATVREACRRLRGSKVVVTGHELEWDMIPYDVQLIGGIVLHEGKIAEMATGEGKTLVATLPSYLNALSGRGAHLVTVNNYLARRDPMDVHRTASRSHGGCIDDTTPSPERHAAYAATSPRTNNELDLTTCATTWCSRRAAVQREHHTPSSTMDSILVDEATPPIISGRWGTTTASTPSQPAGDPPAQTVGRRQ
jgi:preprotein translocase subunit SecA